MTLCCNLLWCDCFTCAPIHCLSVEFWCIFWQGTFLDIGWKRNDDELFVRSKYEHQFSRELIKIFIWSSAVRELCLHACDKFMPFEISNLIVYFFLVLWLQHFLFLCSQVFARGNSNLPFRCCSWEAMLCKWICFCFPLCMWEEW